LKRLLFLLISISFVFNFCSSKTNKVETEITFANKMAMRGLWKEAYFRWQKSLAREGESALLHNNMAVALEKMGKLAEAEKEYEKALKLAPGNNFINTNMKSLKRILEGKDNEEDKDEGKEQKRKEGKEGKENEKHQ
jgi:tetratricopeptide (TPR) repeat protein